MVILFAKELGKRTSQEANALLRASLPPIWSVVFRSRCQRSLNILKQFYLSEIILKPLFRVFFGISFLDHESIFSETQFAGSTNKTILFGRITSYRNNFMQCSELWVGPPFPLHT